MANFFHLTNVTETFYGSSIMDVIFGYDGNDTLYGEGGNDWLFGGNGNDWLYGGADNDWLLGGEGHDRLFGGEGTNTLNGGNGNDRFYGGAGADEMLGGNGQDWVIYRDATAGVSVDFALGRGWFGEANNDTYFSIENAIGTEFYDHLKGDDANNTFYGLGGDDDFAGSFGADTYYGGSGLDRATYAQSPDAVVINLATNVSTGGHAEGDKLYQIESVVGSLHDDHITGDAFANFISGEKGHDVILGGDGDDKLHGNDGNDILYGGDGDDHLTGGEGNDTFYGGAGGDSFRGDTGQDWVNYTSDGDGHVYFDAVGVVVDLLSGNGSGGDAEGDTYYLIENINGTWNGDDQLLGDNTSNKIRGWNGDDHLVGRGGRDNLRGGDGRDTLEGGASADDLSGGHGSDTFVYRDARDSTSDAMDMIDHWDNQWSWWNGSEHDKFDFREIDANPFVDGNQELEWINDASFSDVGQVREIRGGGVTYVHVNLDGDLDTSEMVIKIEQAVDLNHGDFLM